MTLPAEMARIGLALEAGESVAEGQKVVRTLDQIKEAAGKSAEKLDKSNGVVGEFVDKMKRLAGILGLGLGIKQLIDYAETWTNLNIRMKIATDTANEFGYVQDRLVDIANRASEPLGEQIELFIRWKQAIKDTRYTSMDLTTTMDAMNAMLEINGVHGAKAASAMEQISRAFTEGTLRGNQFRVLTDAMPKLLDVLATQLGVPREQLRLLAAQGRITMDTIIEASKKQNAALQKEADAMPKSIGQALTVLNNHVLVAVGKFNDMYDITGKLSGAVGWLTDHLGLVSKVLAGIGIILAANALPAFLTSVVAGTGIVGSFFGAIGGGLTILRGLPVVITGVVWGLGRFAATLISVLPELLAFLAPIAGAIAPFVLFAAAIGAVGYAVYRWIKTKRDAREATEALAQKQRDAAAAADMEADAQRRLAVELQATALERQKALNAAMEDLRRQQGQTDAVAAALASGGVKAAERVKQANAIVEQSRSIASSTWAGFIKELEDRNAAEATKMKTHGDVWKAAAAGVWQAEFIIEQARKKATSDSRLDLNTAAAEKAMAALKEQLEKHRANLMAEADAILAAKMKIAESRQALSDQLIQGIEDPLTRERAQLAMERRQLEAQIKDMTANIYDPGAVKFIEDSMRNQFLLGKQITVVLAEQAQRQQAFADRTAEVKRVTEEAAAADQEFLVLQAALAGERERQLRQPLENALGSVQSLLSDTFDKFFANQLRSANDFGQALVQIARKTAAEMTAQFLMTKALGIFAPTPTLTKRPVVGSYDIGDLIPSISSLIGRSTSGSAAFPATGGSLDKILGSLPSLFAGVHHTGGVVGSAASVRSVDPRLFDGADRTANLNLRPNEVPIIAQRGERILPAGASEKAGPQTHVNMTMPFTIQALDATDLDGAIERAAPKIQEIIARGVSQSTRYAQHLRGR